MFCGKCGAKNADYAEFCTNCGAKVGKSNSENRVLIVADQDEKKKIGIITVAVVAIIVVVIAFIGFFLFGGRGYKSTIDKYVDAIYEADGEALLDLLPDKLVDYGMVEYAYERNSDDIDIMDELNEMLQAQVDSTDSYYGKGWEVSNEITDDEDIKGDDLDDIKRAYEVANIKVSAAKNVEVVVTVKGGETENSYTVDIALIKSGRSWYLDMFNL